MKPYHLLFLIASLTLPFHVMSQNKTLDDIIEAYQTFEKEDNDPKNNRPPRLSTEDFEKRGQSYQQLLDRLDAIPKKQLSGQDQINHELLTFLLQDKVDEIMYANYLVPMNAEGGWYSRLPSSMDRRRFRDTSDYRKYMDVLNAFTGISEANMELMAKGAMADRTLPRVLLGNCRTMVENQVVENIEDSPFFTPFNNLPDNISPADQRQLKKEGREAVGRVVHLYQMFLDFLDSIYIPKSNPSIGISAQPMGREIYEQRVRFFTTLDMTPEEVYETGKKEVARIRKEMEAIVAEVGFEGSFQEFLDFLRTDEQFYAKTPEEILKEASYLSKKIDGLLPKYFGKLPRNSYGVEPVPAAIAPTYTSGRYSPGSLKNGRAGHYWVNTTKLSSRPLYALPSLTLHEAVPGHHLQISLAQEMEDMPPFRQNTYLSAFGEGWALYTEWLGEEMGIYTTPYERFGKLTYEMWRACRLVVDPGMHVFGMSRQEAIDFMSSNTALSIHECTTEVDRYIGWPGQAVSYKIGELKIRELRKMAEKELGEQFDIRAFHDLVLSNGAVPLFTLERMVKEWVQEKGR